MIWFVRETSGYCEKKEANLNKCYVLNHIFWLKKKTHEKHIRRSSSSRHRRSIQLHQTEMMFFKMFIYKKKKGTEEVKRSEVVIPPSLCLQLFVSLLSVHLHCLLLISFNPSFFSPPSLPLYYRARLLLINLPSLLSLSLSLLNSK